MIRILQYIGPLQIGGSQSFILEIYRKIDKTKIQFDFIVFPKCNKSLKNEIENLGGIIYESPQYNGKNHIIYKKWWNDFFCYHPEYKILHGHVRSVAAIYVAIAKKYGLKTIVHSHSTSNGSGIQSLFKTIFQFPIRYQADYLLACSQEAGKWLFGRNAVKKKNYHTFLNAIDVKRYTFNINMREQLRSDMGLNDFFVIGHIGRLSEPKNHKFLFLVFKEVLNYDNNVRLLLVGDGELRKELENYCHELGISDYVIFMGNVINTEWYYWVMDIFVFPSLWEGMPISVLEAQASGLNCLVSDRVTKEVSVTKRIMYLPLEIKEKEWAKVVIKVKKQKKRSALSETEKGLRYYDSQIIADQFEKFYMEIYD